MKMANTPKHELPDPPWHLPVRVDDVPEAGRHVDMVADAATREAMAAFANVNAVPQLSAAFHVTRRGKDGLRVSGEVRAVVGQTCVVTLEPMESEIVEPVDVIYEPPRADAESDRSPPVNPGASRSPVFEETEDPPEPLLNGIADLGALATEFLMLGIDPYPRKPESAFEPPAAEAGETGPFAALARLKRGDDGGK
jgi:hypothetical protein